MSRTSPQSRRESRAVTTGGQRVPRAVFTAPDWRLRCDRPNWRTELPRGFSVRHAIEQRCRYAVYEMPPEALFGLDVAFPRIEVEYDYARRLSALLRTPTSWVKQRSSNDASWSRLAALSPRPGQLPLQRAGVRRGQAFVPPPDVAQDGAPVVQ